MKKKNDGLIFYFSGHGVKDRVVMSNGDLFSIDKLLKIMCGEQCVWLRDKAKIMIFDCCRGDKDEQLCENYNEYSGLGLIFANFLNFGINDSHYESCLSRAFEQNIF